MTPNDFRHLALSLPEAVESAHMGHPDYRIRGKIFATLAPPGEVWGMVKLSPDEQSLFVRTEPRMFQAFPGGWGKQGCTKVILNDADESSVRQALLAAWKKTAPKRLVRDLGI